MTSTKTAILLSTTRPTRFCHIPGQWLQSVANKRGDSIYEIVDLRDHRLPFFEEAASPLWKPSTEPAAQAFQKRIAEFDAFVFVTAEYNHGPPAVLKNALDYAYNEWVRKPVAFFGYGGAGGARAVEQLRGICIELQMAPTRFAVHFQGNDFLKVLLGGGKFDEFTGYLEPLANDMLNDLAWWTRALKTARQAG